MSQRAIGGLLRRRAFWANIFTVLGALVAMLIMPQHAEWIASLGVAIITASPLYGRRHAPPPDPDEQTVKNLSE